MKKGVLFFILLMHAPSVWAFNGRVTYISGKATILSQHKMQASELKLNQGLLLDTSIVTEEKSLVKISMMDGSIVTVGPNSRIHIQSFINPEKKIPGIFSLVRGRIGASINDQTKIAGFKSKFLLKTPNAVVGVRGTEFLVHVEKNKTTLVAFNGDVTIAKSDVKRNANIDEITKAFVSESVIVKPGEFIMVQSNDKRNLAAQKLNPLQLGILEKRTLAHDAPLASKMISEEQEVVLSADDGKIVYFKEGSTINTGKATLNVATEDIDAKKVVAMKEEPKTVVQASPVLIEDPVKPKMKRWYAGLSLGIANSSIETANITQEMSSRGISGQGEVRDSTRFAWRLFTGYDFTKHIAMELSYLDLGKTRTEFRNVSQADLYKLSGVNSISGKGPQLSGRINAYVSEQLLVFAKAGMFYWDNSSNDSSHVEFTHGYGLELKAPESIAEKVRDMRLRLDYDFYRMKENSTHLITVGLVAPIF